MMILYLSASLNQGIETILDSADLHDEFLKTITEKRNDDKVKVNNKIVKYDAEEDEEINDGWNETKAFCSKIFGPIINNLLLDYKSRNILIILTMCSIDGIFMFLCFTRIKTKFFNLVNDKLKNQYLKYTSQSQKYPDFRSILFIYQIVFFTVLYFLLWFLSGEAMICLNITVFFLLLGIISNFLIFYSKFNKEYENARNAEKDDYVDIRPLFDDMEEEAPLLKVEGQKKKADAKKSIPLEFISYLVIGILIITSLFIIHNKYVIVISYFLLFIILMFFITDMFRSFGKFIETIK